jgi:hypothetical protein
MRLQLALPAQDCVLPLDDVSRPARHAKALHLLFWVAAQVAARQIASLTAVAVAANVVFFDTYAWVTMTDRLKGGRAANRVVVDLLMSEIVSGNEISLYIPVLNNGHKALKSAMLIYLLILGYSLFNVVYAVA